jgi:hypothetical protein
MPLPTHFLLPVVVIVRKPAVWLALVELGLLASAKTMEIGWSFRRSVPMRVIPSGIFLSGVPTNVQVEVPSTLGVLVYPPDPGRFLIASNATVPSWHERHASEVPVGWVGRASRVELLYKENVAVVCARFHNGAATFVSAPCGV